MKLSEIKQTLHDDVLYFIPFIKDNYEGVYPIDYSEYDNYEVEHHYIQGDKLKVILGDCDTDE